MATHEHTINDALAATLRDTRRVWNSANVVISENTGLLKGSSKRPDILVLEPFVSPVVIEAEIGPALSVEVDTISRLGSELRNTGRMILSSVSVRYPKRLVSKQGKELRKELDKSTDLEFALYTGITPSNWTRWPKTGWIHGSVSALSLLVQTAAVPPDVIDAAANQLVFGVTEAAGLLDELSLKFPGAIQKICEQLCQEDSEQTRRMAATILANALVFQESLAGSTGDLANVKSLEELRGSKTGLTKATILLEWRKILKVNYWPIFDIARRILELVPASETSPILDRLSKTAANLMENRLMRSHDLTGAVFQRLIVDRKFLAAFYTTPSSAALLIGLAVLPNKTPGGGSWASAQDVKAIRIGDFACGTGTLLSTAYQRIGQLHELSGGDSEAIHPEMMANCIIGCDVLPAAAHLTASMISGAHPTVKYYQSRIFTLAYGRQANGGIALGSLDLLDSQRKLEILDITAKVAGAFGEKESELWMEIPDASFDLVIMNPPFTRPTVHEAERLKVPNPMFAAFSSTPEEQRLMSEATRKLTEGTSAHGNAGEASIFLVLADRKLKSGGVLAMVMPLSLISGESWESSRGLLANNYDELILVSIANAENDGMSFSADTGMGECLVVGRKSKQKGQRATFVILNERPSYPLPGAIAADQIRKLIGSNKLRRLEDGPFGGTPLFFGDDLIGQVMEAPIPQEGGWNLARIADLSLAQAAYQLAIEHRAWMPSMNKSDSIEIPINLVGNISEIGPIHRDINGRNPNGDPRGPFDIVSIEPNKVPTYPVLWSHEASRERSILFEADSEGIPRPGRSEVERSSLDLRIANILESASHCHFNCDFRFNSQSTGMQFTSRKTIGGVAWLSIKLLSVDHEKALVLFSNTTLGLLLRWWHSNKQQSGRGRIGKSTLQTLPVLDVTALNSKQLSTSVKLFDKMCKMELLPIHEIDKDSVRKELDERFARDVLGFSESIIAPGGPLELLRMKLAQEPSIRGQK